MFEIELWNDKMNISYEKGNIVFYVQCVWWWDKYSQNAFGEEWVTIDLDIEKAEWWVEDIAKINKLEHTKMYKKWLIEEIEHIRRNEGFLYEEMQEEIQRLDEQEMYLYGI